MTGAPCSSRSPRAPRPSRTGRPFTLGLLCALAWGCGAEPDRAGVGAWLRVDGAQLHRGRFAAAEGGPRLTSLLDPETTFRRGEVGHDLSGTAAAGTTAVALFLDGDAGYWMVPADVPDVTAPDEPTFRARLSLAAHAPLGPRPLVARAVDAAGRAGPPAIDAVTIVDAPPIAGELVVTLAWDGDADLDLRVVEPSGVEVSSRSPRDPATGAQLDLDSNARCVIDGVRRESVAWPTAPRPGRYVVRVDTPSLCSAPFAPWRVSARLHGAVVAEARGESTPASTRGAHDRGAGLTALELDVP